MEEDSEDTGKTPANVEEVSAANSGASTPVKTIASQSTQPPHIPMSVGSYRGRNIMMPVVKNPEVYAEAASMGDVTSFIGGLDGRSGVDDGDLNSYRMSVGQLHLSGEPRSFTERFLMEEARALQGNRTEEQR